MNDHPTHLIEWIATVCFALAIVHTFMTSVFQKLAHMYEDGSIGENLFHLLGEVEVVFGFWAGLFLISVGTITGFSHAIHLVDQVNFTEPLFVFAIMTVASTKPIIEWAQNTILRLARVISRKHESLSMYFLCLTLGPLMGSFITEPAAMTVTALILYHQFYQRNVSTQFKYITLAALFVNVSIGGVLTPYAAPPVLMVASLWGWDLPFMLTNFGWKAAVGVTINASLALAMVHKELLQFERSEVALIRTTVPTWLTMVHGVFLAAVVLTAHHPSVFMGILLYFIGVTTITREYQSPLKIKQSLLVAYFLGGLVVLGSFQGWWLSPILARLDVFPLFAGATGLTAFTDNAALTFLGAQVEGLSDALKYALVAGAVAGGGLTVIANAPNPAGFSIMQDRFGPEGIAPLKLFLYAIVPTLVAMSCLWFL
jgi:hypothetical protein